ncbi:hypothetical protein AJ80_03906 [Polytolypa hystricis UAMH7299]|uniref:Ribonuclease P protein subunit n=1 Tax=Polytolypa hystricis (strain UAMH7299) TaxID=1447883 RepID=A0A2B7YEE9_POLH7|nr:hypothetical protein AJ80_03906 [Polytolypa hystricis UAMH7299]
MASSGLPASAQSHMAHQLLSRAHSPDTTAKLFTERVKNRPLFLRPTSPTPEDNRARRRLHRLRKKEYFLRKQKPQPFSAREKRKTGIHKLRKEEIKYDVFKGLHKMWVNYMHGVLGLNQDKKNQGKVTALSHGPMLASADFHGAELEVVRSRCVSRVGVKGIVVRDSKFSFVIVTEKNESKSNDSKRTYSVQVSGPSRST